MEKKQTNKHRDKSSQRLQKKGKTLYLSAFKNTFFLLCDEGAPHFPYSVASPANNVGGTLDAFCSGLPYLFLNAAGHPLN